VWVVAYMPWFERHQGRHARLPGVASVHRRKERVEALHRKTGPL